MKKFPIITFFTLGFCFVSSVVSAAVNSDMTTNANTTSEVMHKAMGIASASNNNANQANPAYRVNKPIFYGTNGAYPFSSAVRVGNTLYMSGQMGLKNGKLVDGGVKAQTKQAFANMNQTLLQYGYQKSDLVKCMVMLTDMNDFKDFNEVYASELSQPYPVRSAFAVADLALGGSVEIECMAAK